MTVETEMLNEENGRLHRAIATFQAELMRVEKERDRLAMVHAERTVERDRLRKVSQAVVDRWNTPLWKDVSGTAEYINALRRELGNV